MAPPHYLLHELFERSAKRVPDLPAVQWKDASLTYAELDLCASALAGWLSRRGVGRASVVGLMLDRSLEMVVAIIGVLKSGAAYLPLLPSWPLQQRLEILKEADCSHLVLQSAFQLDFVSFEGAKFEFDDCKALAKAEPPPIDTVVVEPTDIAYIIFTSGSTGRPKGVMMHHGGTAQNIALNAQLSCQEGSRCCFSNKYTFDVHVGDIFKPLSVGGVIVVSRDIFRIPPVDVVSTLPNKVAVAKVPMALKAIVFTGEGITESCIRPIPVTTQALNIFGATEFYDATLKIIDRKTFPARLQSIGKPLGDYVRLWVMDPETLELKPCGESGELVVGGFQLARGYIKRPDLNSVKFFTAPWLVGANGEDGRVYRTGDLVRCCEDGEFEYLGRIARQVLVRGHRLDLGSVEDVLTAVEGIACAAVILRLGVDDEPQLVAYVSPSSAKDLVKPAVAILPAHMTPSLIVGVDDWPTTSSGKIDRNRLHEVEIQAKAAAESKAPKETVKRIQWIFRDAATDAVPSANPHEDSDSEVEVELLNTDSCHRFAALAVESCIPCLPSLSAFVQMQAYRHGAVFFNKPLPAPAEVAPMTLLPSPVPQPQFEKLRALALIFSRLVDRVTCDVDWLLENLEPLLSVDPFMARLLAMAKTIYGPNGAAKDPRSESRLLLMRQDYLPHSDGSYLQVEINTIAVAFAGLTEQVSKVHAQALSMQCPEASMHGELLQNNAPGTDYAKALAAAHQAYLASGSDGEPKVCFFCFPGDHLEMDQRHTEGSLATLCVPAFRAFLGAKVELKGGNLAKSGAGGTLFVDGIETSVVYFHCTYSPEHFASEADWENRERIELSKAIKAPSLLGHLAGAKKVQEILSDPKELAHFISEEEAASCCTVFARQLDPSRPSSAAAVADALERPERWVLKPQREGGGNNFYGADLTKLLRANEGLSQYVLMEKIQSVPLPAAMLRGSEAIVADAVGELGIFSAYLASGEAEVLNTVGGALLRTKEASSEEGGVCAGFGVLDTPFLAKGTPGQAQPKWGGESSLSKAPAEPQREARVCLLLVCGLPGCGKTTWCRNMVARSQQEETLLGKPAEWRHLCYDEVEAECRAALGATDGVFDPATWRHSRLKAAEVVRKHVADRLADSSAPNLVLLLDDNMYYRSMRKQWYHFASENACAFRQIFFEAPLPTCLERNAGRPPANRVPDFSIRHMSEVFQWPKTTGSSWEALELVSTTLDALGLSETLLVEAFLCSFGDQPGSFWGQAALVEEDSAGPSGQGGGHYLDLALGKVVSRALAEAPKELAKEKSNLAKQWSARKAAMVAQLTTLGGGGVDAEALINELEETFLRSCVADTQDRVRGKSTQVEQKVSIIGPPYRWLQIDCRCYFSENLYVRSADAYFTMPSPDATDEGFWAVNDAGTYDSPQREAIFAAAKAEASRRTKLPEVYLQNAQAIRRSYRPLHQELFPAPCAVLSSAPGMVAPGLAASAIFSPLFLSVWQTAVAGDAATGPNLKHVHDGCFECPLLTREFCARIKSELRHFKSQNLPHQQPNTMNRNGCILNEIGLGPLMDRIIKLYIEPVCRVLYPDMLGPGWDSHHSFVVDYGVGKDTNLGVHDDNSEVTVNIALSEDYSGAELALYHRARVAHPQKLEKKPYLHRVGMGTMLLHPGELLHEVLPLSSGDRQGLIIWLRSNAYRRQHGCALCRLTDGLMY